MTGKPKNPFEFWEELRQRKVVRVITVYVASAFALLEAADIIFPKLGLPSWTVTIVLILLACGLIISIVLSWIYDITPQGIKRTSEVSDAVIESGPLSGQAYQQKDKIHPKGTDEYLLEENRLYAEKLTIYRRKEKIYSFSSLVVVVSVIILFLFSSSRSVPFKQSDWIIISDFENLTEYPVFDKSLYTAFSLTIDQSRHINIYPKDRIIETLARMQLEDTGYLDEKTAREVALREGINILISPNISEIGNNFVITAKIIETSSGNLLKSVILEAENRDHILPELDHLSKRIRRDLGESRYKIAIQDKPLVKVTTSSLEALKQFSLGIENHLRLNFQAAKTYYENALNIDTGFIMAKASLGTILLQNFGDEKGKVLLGQAARSVDKLTDKEKYTILASYAVKVENDYEKGIENTRILTRLYPDDPLFHHNLGFYLQVDGQFEEAITEYKTTVRLNPYQALSFGGILWIYLEKLGLSDSALVWSRKMISVHPQNAWGYFYLGSAYASTDSLQNALSAFLKAREINPYFVTSQYRLARTYFNLKYYKEAIQILERVAETNKNEIAPYYEIGVNYQAMGNSEEARKSYKKYLETAEKVWLTRYPDLADTYLSLGAGFARLDDTTSAMSMFRKALSIDSTLYIRYAELFCLLDRIPDAISQIEKALLNGYRDLYWLKNSIELVKLHDEQRFKDLLDEYFSS